MKSPEAKLNEKLMQLGQDSPFVAGSLSRVERTDKQGRTTVYHLLTFKEAGKTRSVYVPKGMLKEVERWTLNYRRIKSLLAEVSMLGIALIRSHVPQERAAAASRRGRTSGR
jgi:DNA-binding transcriptional ArsR family regulator